MRLRTKIMLCVAAACGFFGYVAVMVSPPIKQAAAQVPGAQILTSLTGSEYIQNWNATVSQLFSSATMAGYSRATGLLYTTLTTVSDTATTAEQTLASYSLPANTLNVGTKLEVQAAFSAASDGNNKTFKCYFGSEVISSGTLSTNNKNGFCDMVITKIAPNQQIVWANMQVDTTNITVYVATNATETDSLPIIMKFTGTNGTASAGDIVMDDFAVYRFGQ